MSCFLTDLNLIYCLTEILGNELLIRYIPWYSTSDTASPIVFQDIIQKLFTIQSWRQVLLKETQFVLLFWLNFSLSASHKTTFSSIGTVSLTILDPWIYYAKRGPWLGLIWEFLRYKKHIKFVGRNYGGSEYISLPYVAILMLDLHLKGYFNREILEIFF